MLWPPALWAAEKSGLWQRHLASTCTNVCRAVRGRFERDRPELAAVALSADTGYFGSTPQACVHYLARQVHALGQAGDVLLIMTVSGNEASLLDAIEAAHERDLIVVALTGHTGGAVAAKMREMDVLVCVPHEQPARVRERIRY